MPSSFAVGRRNKRAIGVPHLVYGQASCCKAGGSTRNRQSKLFNGAGALFHQYDGAGISELKPGQYFRGTACCNGSLTCCAGRF